MRFLGYEGGTIGWNDGRGVQVASRQRSRTRRHQKAPNRSGDIGGLAVHIAARVAASDSGSGVLVSSTVRELLLGSDVELESIGEQDLKGILGRWTLFKLSSSIVNRSQTAQLGTQP